MSATAKGRDMETLQQNKIYRFIGKSSSSTFIAKVLRIEKRYVCVQETEGKWAGSEPYYILPLQYDYQEMN